MMKKDQFLIGLRANLRLRVELKKPKSYKEAMEIAKRKEWKLSMMSKMGMTDALPLPMEMRRTEPIVQRVPVEVLQPIVQPIVSPVVPPTVAVATDDGLRHEASGGSNEEPQPQLAKWCGKWLPWRKTAKSAQW